MREAQQCMTCNETYIPKRLGTVCCSRACGFELLRIRRAKAPSSKIHYLNCKQCGDMFIAPRKNAGYCGDSCRRAFDRARYLETAKAASSKVSRQCKECKATFTPEYGDKRRSFCSPFCYKRSARRVYNRGLENHRRRARHYGVDYEPVNRSKLFQRDNWTCQICGIKTPQRLKGTTEPNAPELDHRIPLSKGGGHIWSNVQLACRECNLKKGGDIAVGQMPLWSRPTA